MTIRLLRIEGVNQKYTIDDTEDLAVRRGGSLMLLDAIESVREKFKSSLSAVSTGASVGLFAVRDNAPADLVGDVRAHLERHPLFRFCTHVVAVSEGDDFKGVNESALAVTRWQQMQSLSFSPIGLAATVHGPCDIDEVRPAQQANPARSASVAARSQDGRVQKQRFYARSLDDARYANVQFTRDFEDLSLPAPVGLEPGTLAGKLAVFYADGNKFGAIAQGCRNSTQLAAWDAYLKAQRKAMLSAVVERAMQSPRWQTPAGELRLETLLWGGDEVMFAVPAWCGLELAQLFFEQTKSKSFVPPPLEFGSTVKGEAVEPTLLTHAAGLVFCHRQAPISRISQLARDLADLGKANGGRTDSLNWLVLESFDHVGGELDAYMKRRFVPPPHPSPPHTWSDLALSTEAIDRLTLDMPLLKSLLPRSSIVRAVRMMAHGAAFTPEDHPFPLVERTYVQVDAACRRDGLSARFEDLWALLHPARAKWDAHHASRSDLAAWVKLIELWDYCPDHTNARQGALA